VPRGRVYANYVSRCATERVTVLNPASFGKLVRVLFPGLKTRRLGVRGESKYHYVNFSLKEDQPNLIENPSTQKYQPMKTAEAKRVIQEPRYTIITSLRVSNHVLMSRKSSITYSSRQSSIPDFRILTCARASEQAGII
jgi:hypothetical protein